MRRQLQLASPAWICIVAGGIFLFSCFEAKSQEPERSSQKEARVVQAIREAASVQNSGKPFVVEQMSPGLFLALALDGQSPAFEGDIHRVRDRFFHQAAVGSTLILSNLIRDRTPHPFADLKTIPMVGKAAGSWLEGYRARNLSVALAVVVISSHGANNGLVLRVGAEPPQAILLGDYLNRLLDDLGDGPILTIISACYSGALVSSLAAKNRIIITSSAADRVSFGCDAKSSSTFFIQALFDQTLSRTLSINEIFAQARNRIIGFEMRAQLPHSLPQISVGEDLEILAASPISKWSAALKNYRSSVPR